MEPVSTSIAIAQGVQAASSIASDWFGGKSDAELTREELALKRILVFIDTLDKEQARKQENAERGARYGVAAPIAKELMYSALSGGIDDPFSAIRANASPRKYEGAPGPNGERTTSLTPPQTIPGAKFGDPSTIQRGPGASPEELAALIPNFERFNEMREKARAATAGITKENLFTPRESTMGELPNFDMMKSKGGILQGTGAQARENAEIARITGGPQLTREQTLQQARDRGMPDGELHRLDLRLRQLERGG